MSEQFNFSSAAIGLVSTSSTAPSGIVTVRKLPVTHTVFHQVSPLSYIASSGCSPIRNFVYFYSKVIQTQCKWSNLSLMKEGSFYIR